MRAFFTLGLMMLLGSTAQAELKTETIDYKFDGVTLKGYVAYDAKLTGKRPAVLIVHEWWGLNDYAKKRANMLAEMGYVAFCVDMYGDGKTTEHPQQAGEMATLVRKNLDVWRGRATAGLKVLTDMPQVDKSKVAAIGYCFGGSTALQLAYSGADLVAVATFHAALPTPSAEEAKSIKAKVLICTGADDTFIPEASITKFKTALTEAKVPLQFESYPGAVHSFTVKGIDEKKIPGIAYNEAAEQKSWASMKELFQATLGK